MFFFWSGWTTVRHKRIIYFYCSQSLRSGWSHIIWGESGRSKFRDLDASHGNLQMVINMFHRWGMRSLVHGLPWRARMPSVHWAQSCQTLPMTVIWRKMTRWRGSPWSYQLGVLESITFFQIPVAHDSKPSCRYDFPIPWGIIVDVWSVKLENEVPQAKKKLKLSRISSEACCIPTGRTWKLRNFLRCSLVRVRF